MKAYPQFRSSYSHEEMVTRFRSDSGRVATGAHVPRRREPLWHGAASENDLSSGLCARPNVQDKGPDQIGVKISFKGRF